MTLELSKPREPTVAASPCARGPIYRTIKHRFINQCLSTYLFIAKANARTLSLRTYGHVAPLPCSKQHVHHLVSSFGKVLSRVAMAGMSDDEGDRVHKAKQLQ